MNEERLTESMLAALTLFDTPVLYPRVTAWYRAHRGDSYFGNNEGGGISVTQYYSTGCPAELTYTMEPYT